MDGSAGPSDSANQSPNEMARSGMHLFLNNKASEAETLFAQNKDSSVQMRGGYCFMTFMNAMMTFEEDKIAHSLQVLKETEQRCGRDLATLHGMKKLFTNTEEAAANYEQRLEQQVVLGDCHVCLAMLLFTFQEVSGYVKGGWVLRKAWKVYDRTYREIKKLYLACFGSIPENLAHEPLPELPPLSSTEDPASSDVSNGWLDTFESQETLRSISRSASIAEVTCTLPEDVVLRLMSAISFGYGMFQLCVSLSPPSVLKMVHLLGLEGNREVALNCLGFSAKGDDMRSPLSAITLLWFHTIIRPFFGLDDQNVAAGIDHAALVLADCKGFENAAMFLFYQGRIERLKGSLDEALVIFRNGVSACEQKEVQFICYQEIGWCLLLKLMLDDALKLFLHLKREMRWGRPIHTYFAAICFASLGQVAECQTSFTEIPNLVKRKHNQLEGFVLKRAQYHAKNDITQDVAKLYIMELLYLWRTLPCAPDSTKSELLSLCTKMSLPSRLIPIKCLIEGVLHGDRGEINAGRKSLEEAITKGAAIKEEHHAPAFACYELGLSLGKDQATANQAKQQLQQAKDNYKGYDFENRLNVRVHSAQINLERRNSAGNSSS